MTPDLPVSSDREFLFESIIKLSLNFRLVPVGSVKLDRAGVLVTLKKLSIVHRLGNKKEARTTPLGVRSMGIDNYRRKAD